MNGLNVERTNNIAKTVTHFFQCCENLIPETFFSKFLPDLFNWIHFRCIRRNEKQLYVLRNKKRSGFMPCGSVAAQENDVVGVLL